MLFPLLLLGGGGLTLLIIAMSDSDGPVPVHEPDLPPTAAPPAGFPKSTRYRLIDAILSELKQAADSSGIPLGLLVGWIAKESGGRLGEITKLDERGYFQLMPAESAALGLDHQRLSTDPVYSINAGLLLIGKYMKAVDALGVAQRGSEFYWMLVKLAHTMGTGAMNKIVAMAKDVGDAGNWNKLESYAVDHDSEILSAVKHSPKKWFPLVDAVRDVGKPFGFGVDSSQSIVGAGVVYADIIDPLDCLKSS